MRLQLASMSVNRELGREVSQTRYHTSFRSTEMDLRNTDTRYDATAFNLNEYQIIFREQRCRFIKLIAERRAKTTRLALVHACATLRRPTYVNKPNQLA